MRLIPILILMFVVTACTNPVDQVLAVKNRASYDFSCAPDKIVVTPLQTGTYGAAGCKYKQVYETRGTMVYKEGAAPNPVYVESPAYYGRFGYYY